MFNVVSFETSASGVKFPGTNPTAWLLASVESWELFLFLFSSQLFSVMPLLLAIGMRNEGLVSWFWSRDRAFLLWSSLDYNPMTPLCSPAAWTFTFFKLSHNPPRWCHNTSRQWPTESHPKLREYLRVTQAEDASLHSPAFLQCGTGSSVFRNKSREREAPSSCGPACGLQTCCYCWPTKKRMAGLEVAWLWEYYSASVPSVRSVIWFLRRRLLVGWVIHQLLSEHDWKSRESQSPKLWWELDHVGTP